MRLISKVYLTAMMSAKHLSSLTSAAKRNRELGEMSALGCTKQNS
jgi:hypothetical protein